MYIYTEITRPPAPRIAQLTDSIVLPRPVSVKTLAAITVGVVGALPIAAITTWVGLPAMYSWLLIPALSAMLCVWVSNIQLWQGESMVRTAMVAGFNKARTKMSLCPGSGRTGLWDDDSNEVACAVCGILGEATKDELLRSHFWRRRLYIGMTEVAHPALGVVRVVPGNMPVRR